MDEEYIACLIESCKSGSVDPSKLEREKIRRILTKKPHLAERIMRSMTEKEGMAFFEPEMQRVRTVVSKLARAHVAYENNTYCMPEPRHIMFRPLITMSETERHDFEDPFQTAPSLWPEVGSGAMQRLLESSAMEHQYQWIIVQEGRYRYLFYMHDDSPAVHLVIGEYLAAGAHW